MIKDFVSKFIEETRNHPLNVTVPEAQLLHDFAEWVDKQHVCTCDSPVAGYGVISNKCKKCNKPLGHRVGGGSF